MLILPIQVDVPMRRLPWMNVLLILILVVVYNWQLAEPYASERFILNISERNHHFDPIRMLLGDSRIVREHPASFIAHIFMHGSWMHLIGNCVFMWVFGNAVCAKVGNLQYAALWILGGLFASLYDITLGTVPTLGASGAITFVAGFFITFYLLNDVRVLWFYIIRGGIEEFSSVWLILTYVAFDLLGILTGPDGVNHLAHLSGYLGGFGLGALTLKLGWLHAEPQERSIFDVLNGRKDRFASPMRSPQRDLLRRQLYVHLGNGNVERRLVANINPDMLVSEDTTNWTTLQDWKTTQKNRTLQPI